jgi:Arc/MetJ-type ribon-helix-helix transcriptional regulator
MHPITLGLPTDLLSELNDEADEAGFSSRSEYIRHLLQNRKDASELFASEAESTTSEHGSSTDVADTVDELSGDLNAMEDRVNALKRTVGVIRFETRGQSNGLYSPYEEIVICF